MYVGPNKIAEARAYRATVAESGLSGIFSKIFGKILPRELSPHQMRKKSAKRKAQVQALKSQISETERAAANQVADAQAQAQVEILKAKSLPASPVPGAGFSIPSPTQSFALTEQNPGQSIPVAPVASTASAAAPEENKTLLYAGIGAAALLGLYLFNRGRK